MKHSVYILVHFGSKSQTLFGFEESWLGQDKETTNSDITSRTQLVKIIFRQLKLKLELIIHKVLHAPHPPLTF